MHNEELYNLHSAPNIVMIKSNETERVARMGVRYAHKILVEETSWEIQAEMRG
jgi:hypothetical protein